MLLKIHAGVITIAVSLTFGFVLVGPLQEAAFAQQIIPGISQSQSSTSSNTISQDKDSWDI